MPFVQRIVQPVHLARVRATSDAFHAENPGVSTTLPCLAGKCRNNNCASKRQLQEVENEAEDAHRRTTPAAAADAAASITTAPSRDVTRVLVHANETNKHLRDDLRVAAAEHSPADDDFDTDRARDDHKQRSRANDDKETVGLAIAEDVDLVVNGANPDPPPTIKQPQPPILSMKKLKQHVDFLSTAPSPARSRHCADGTIRNQAIQGVNMASRRRPKSPMAAKIIAGYEFDSISNLTLSNALRQLASLVLIASDIFNDLQCELQGINERAGLVQRKIVTVERRVCAYDPKKITVPESDLLTFSQRKLNYESAKLMHSELFTATTRPHSIRVLYEDAGIELPSLIVTRSRTTSSPLSIGSYGITDDEGITPDDMSDVIDCASAEQDDFLDTQIFGNVTRKMRTRIDAEIEIRLPAAIDDLRKWTSSEALGDVTVTPDCMHHVDTSICTTVFPGELITPEFSPSVLTPDAVDAVYSNNNSNVSDNILTTIPNNTDNGVPLNHRLPSPEEQCKTIALRYPAEVISVDTSGKGFERMCMARKSTISCFIANSISDANNGPDDIQPASRHSRSRKVRGKRRNTIAGFDQKEIQDAANDNVAATSSAITKNALTNTAAATSLTRAEDADRTERKIKKIGRSKSSDILKKDSVALPYDKGKNTLTRLNSLKLWGRNRFKFMSGTGGNANKENISIAQNGANLPWAGGVDAETRRIQIEQPTGSRQMQGIASKDMRGFAVGHNVENSVGGGVVGDVYGGGISETLNNIGSSGRKLTNIAPVVDDENGGLPHLLMPPPRTDGRFSHERKPSYSSSEKSMGASSSGQMRGKLHLATCGNVKMRDTSSLNRQRRSGITAMGHAKDEQPNSSSGNWSASSESGRASIGSETTIQPKSSASNTSLNVSSFHPGSGPPSSMMSRRRFLNTSACSSMTSEGTATPDLQVAESTYPNHLDDETSSSYSCDTEGYYTSFHMDSGLRTLKEEEPALGALQIGQMLPMSSFSCQSNQSTLTAENEYELFGRGSTSTTASSAGTVCTTLMLNGTIGTHNSSNSLGPDVPERISSLGKLNERSHSNSTSTLERSYSSSTIGSSLECTGTIKRNANTSFKLSNTESEDIDVGCEANKNTCSNGMHRSAMPLPGTVTAMTDMEYSESSDLEGVERIERIKQKTALNAKRIPSMCIITPTTSDDENQSKDMTEGEAFDPNRTLTNESSPCSKAAAKAKLQLRTNDDSNYSTVDVVNLIARPASSPQKYPLGKDHNLNTLQPDAMLDKMVSVLPQNQQCPSTTGASGIVSLVACTAAAVEQDALYDLTGEYVTIADISNNNKHNQLPAPMPKATGGRGNLGIYYSNDILKRMSRIDSSNSTDLRSKATSAVSSELPNSSTTPLRRETEYVSLNELPTSFQQLANTKNTGTHTAVTGRQSECAGSAASELRTSRLADNNLTTVPMYAEISEVQEEKALLSAKLSTAPPVQPQHKGAPVRVNAQGKIIYDSDSLKRRKGAHTTFSPGPYVKETESALADVTPKSGAVSESVSLQSEALNSTTAAAGQTVTALPNRSSAAAKLLLLKGGLSLKRKGITVQPKQQQQQQDHNKIKQATPTKSKFSMFQRAKIPTPLAPYLDKHLHTQPSPSQDSINSSAAANTLTASTVNGRTAEMMHSPSTKSTSSTGSGVSSAASTSGSCSASPIGGGYQRLARPTVADSALQQHRINDQLTTHQLELQTSTAVGGTDSSFQRDSPIYWTLQNRRQPKLPISSVTCRDDLYATPLRRSERPQASTSASASCGKRNISPIVPRNMNSFSTSTPTKLDWEDNSPERLNTCSDRMGQTKTSLLDFKKLLLAKSAKSSPVHKVSAVEMLKKSTEGMSIAPTQPNAESSVVSSTKPSMQLLDLSGSPKTFANRRMLRQGQFGSPSRSFAPKLKAPSNTMGAVLRSSGNVKHTDIMSTIIPEANSEDDHSNTSGSRSSRAGSDSGSDVNEEKTLQYSNSDSSPEPDAEADAAADAASQANFNLKRNFFLQTEENNFIRGESKPTFLGKPGRLPESKILVMPPTATNSNLQSKSQVAKRTESPGSAERTAALETAL